MDADDLRPHPAAAAATASDPVVTRPSADTTHRGRSGTREGQLHLLDTAAHPEWKLDEATRAVGRRGIAQARAALRAARAEHLQDASGAHPAPGHPAAADPAHRRSAA